MVLTDKQRSDLHAGIHEYLLSRGAKFSQCAEELAKADPDSCSTSKEDKKSSTGGAPILEKKWTAVPRLQRRVLELERQIATNAKIHAHLSGGDGGGTTGGVPGRERRMLPRPPAVHTLQSHSAVVTAVSIHPVYTMAASGSEDGTM